MRHDPASGDIIIMLRSLKMHGMAQAVGELTEQGSPAFEAAVPILSQLLKAETADREVRSTAYQLKAARFPNYRALTGFDFASSEVSEALLRQLHRCEFLGDAHNVVLVERASKKGDLRRMPLTESMERPPTIERTAGPIAVFSNQWANMPNRTFGCFNGAHPEVVDRIYVLPSNDPPIVDVGKDVAGKESKSVHPLTDLWLTSTNANGKPDWNAAVAISGDLQGAVVFDWKIVNAKGQWNCSHLRPNLGSSGVPATWSLSIGTSKHA